MSIAFFCGLATTMVLFGASATALSRFLFSYLTLLTTIGGIVIIGFGIMSFFGIGFSGVQLLDRPASGVVGSFLYGATFSLGWSACVGPILGALLTLLATQGIAVAQGALLAFVYALGLGSPLIIISSFLADWEWGRRFGNSSKGAWWRCDSPAPPINCIPPAWRVVCCWWAWESCWHQATCLRLASGHDKHHWRNSRYHSKTG